MEILEGLNSEQEAAVRHIDGPMLVLAGAGTGKTQVITRRIAHLIKSGHAKPGEVLALTFTEKAAREMEERLYELIGWQSFQVPVMTFHAFGTELLGRFAPHIGRSVRGGLLNQNQKALLLAQHFERLELNYYSHQDNLYEFLNGIIKYIGELQNENVSPKDYENYVLGLRKEPQGMHERDVEEQADLAKIYSLYEQIKSETGTFDFSDQLNLPLRILQERPNLAERLAQEYKFVLVDEYQDTNGVQDRLLRAFIRPNGNLFVVGDDDQAIYSFRGANVSNILEFSEHFKLARPIALIRNYRSGQAILDASYKLIVHNDPDRLESRLGISKKLIGLDRKSLANFELYPSPLAEQQGVVAKIKGLIEKGASPSDIAVLSSTHAPLVGISRVLARFGVSYSLSTSVSIFEQPEILGLWYLLRWLSFDATDEDITHVILGAIIGWSPEQLRRILDQSKLVMSSIETALRTDDSDASIELIKKIDDWRELTKSHGVSYLVFKIVFESGLADRWRGRAIESPRMTRVFEDLQRLLNHMQDFESISKDTSLGAYMQTYPLPPDIEVAEPIGDAEGVQLLTVHSSKGLEFENVFLIGCTQRAWSTRSAGNRLPERLTLRLEQSPEHEFRRLMYVAVTRAKANLTASASATTQSGARQATSLFVGELFGEKAIKHEQSVVSSSIEGAIASIQANYPLKVTESYAKLPFEDSDGWMHLSVTELAAYEYCPFEFYLNSVLKIQQPLGPYVAFGTVLHKVIEHYNKAVILGRDPEMGELHTFLDELWTNHGYLSEEAAERDLELAHTTLTMFAKRGIGNAKMVASEMPIRFQVPEAKLSVVGKIDAVLDKGDGIELRDYKTGRTQTDAAKLADAAKNSLQLRSYALAYELHNGVAPKYVCLDYVVNGVEGVAELTAVILRNHRAKLTSIAEKIRSKQFAPNPSPAHICAAIKYYGTGERDEQLENLIEANSET